eukprot:528374-Prymnesium_polylepis.2
MELSSLLLLPIPPSPAPPLAASPIKAHIRATSTAPPHARCTCGGKTKKAHPSDLSRTAE